MRSIPIVAEWRPLLVKLLLESAYPTNGITAVGITAVAFGYNLFDRIGCKHNR